MKHYKTYKRKLTNRRKRMYQQIAFILLLIALPAVIIGICQTRTLKAMDELSQTVRVEKPSELNIYPEIENPVRKYVLLEVYKAGLDPSVADKIVNCESRWIPDAHAVNWKNGAGVDRGLFMINSLYHREVSNACAYDYRCAVKEAIRIYKERGNWTAWACSSLI